MCVWFDLCLISLTASFSQARARSCACSKLCVLEAVREARELGYRLCVSKYAKYTLDSMNAAWTRSPRA